MIPHHQFKSFFNLNWNPFQQDIPLETFYAEEQVSRFCWSVEQLVLDGGFAFISGDPGIGKSVALRILQKRLSELPELNVRVMTRPQSRIRDFYREMANLFVVGVQPSNRYGSFQKLREQWLGLIQANMFRPVLIIDEAQEMPDEVLSELRILCSTELDARCILAVIIAGDNRLLNNLQTPTALPLYSRMKAHLALENRTPQTMHDMLTHALKLAGNLSLMTPGVLRALSEQHMGNPRAMMKCANQLLDAALLAEQRQIDENLYFDVTRSQAKKRKPNQSESGRG